MMAKGGIVRAGTHVLPVTQGHSEYGIISTALLRADRLTSGHIGMLPEGLFLHQLRVKRKPGGMQASFVILYQMVSFVLLYFTWVTSNIDRATMIR